MNVVGSDFRVNRGRCRDSRPGGPSPSKGAVPAPITARFGSIASKCGRSRDGGGRGSMSSPQSWSRGSLELRADSEQLDSERSKLQEESDAFESARREMLANLAKVSLDGMRATTPIRRPCSLGSCAARRATASKSTSPHKKVATRAPVRPRPARRRRRSGSRPPVASASVTARLPRRAKRSAG